MTPEETYQRALALVDEANQTHRIRSEESFKC